MRRYGNRHGGSGIVAWEASDDELRVKFRSGEVYVYDADHPGRAHVEAMKRLAERGEGLTSYISRHVREDYARKL